jgi:hypothetical protein
VTIDAMMCPFCAERIEAGAARCWSCHSDLPARIEQPPAGPLGDGEVLASEPRGSRGLIAAGVVLTVVLLACGAALVVSSHRPQAQAPEFNVFTQVKDACQKDDGDVVTADPHGTPMAFATPDGPERYWCVSRDYLTSIGHAPQDPMPPVREVPREFRWLWPRTTYGH